MARDEAYQEAERRIEVARQEGAIELDLSGLGLTELPEAIASLTQLQSFNLSRNQLTELPEMIASLTQLQELNLSSNQLTELPEAIASLTQLQTLDLAENQLTELPESIGSLDELRELILYENQLKRLPVSLGNLKLLRDLNICINSIVELPSSFGQLSKIERLILGAGGGGNPLNVLPTQILQLKSLIELWIRNCNLSTVPEWISEFKNLAIIRLEDNSIQDLPVSLTQLQCLVTIGLDNNPLNPDLAAAVEQGIKAVIPYLWARAGGEVVLNEAKLILVGEGEVGKSCLLGALRDDEWVDGRPTTHGIEIKPVLVSAPNSETEITLNGWDFGGQRVYRPTHQLFFSSTAVYLVVWKLREGPQQGFVKEWITLIKHREPDAKVLVVATHGGPGQRQPDIDRQELIDLFGSDTVVGFFHVDSKPYTETQVCTGIAELREAIANVAATLPGMGRLVPTKWQQIRELLEASGNTHMPYTDVLALCEEHGLEGFAAELFVRVSHTLGYFIHYDHDEILKDIVILQPDWLAKAISYVLDDETTRQRNGLVEFDHLSHLWSYPPFVGETGYPKELHPIFLRLMERFDLSYKVVLDPANPEASTTSLIAQLVPDQRLDQLPNWGEQPEGGDRQQVQICRIVDDRGQSGNAEGLFYQLIVRLHKYSLGRNNYNDSIHWQRGLMLDNDYNGRALLEHIGNDVKITVRAAYPERFLSYLTEEIKWLVENPNNPFGWKGLRCNVMVPCIAPCGMETPGHGLFEVQKLIESKKKNRPDFPCTVSGCDEWQNIDQLLNNAPAAQPPAKEVLGDQLTDVQETLQVIRQELRVKDRLDQKRYQNLSKRQQATMSRVDEQFAYLMQMLTDEVKDGPRLFSFKPVDPGFFDRPKWISEKFQLTLWCEHALKPLPVLNEGSQQGVYELELNREWFTKAVPYFKLVTGTLSLVLPVAASTTQFMLDDATYKGIQEELDLGQKSLEFGIKGSNIAVDWQTKRDGAEFEQGEAVRAQGAMLRELHTLLQDKDPGFGGLVRVQNKRREFLWVHADFVGEY
ncbi:MAG: COR domain-containing protein [Nodosilinea sp.]